MKTQIQKQNNYELITLTNINGFSITVCTLGASLYSVIFSQKEMTLVPEDFKDFIKGNMYYGKTIGRLSNRQKGNKITIENKIYTLENNEGENTLHGGINGLSTKTFEYQILEVKDKTSVVFTYFFKHLEDGLPGNTLIKVIYTIYEVKDEFDIDFSAKTDAKTILSLTNHAYFNLGEQDISPLSLKINSDTFLEVDPKSLLAKKKRKCLPCLDFQNHKKLVKDINDKYLLNSRTNGYDHFFYFKKINTKAPQLSLKSDIIQMDVYTDYVGVQVYSDNYKDYKARGTNKEIRRALAIEPSYSHIRQHRLDKDQIYYRFIKYIFKNI